MVNNEQETREDSEDKKGIGEVKIASDVVAVIAGLAVRVDMALNMKYGYSIPRVTKQVQEKVSQQIENMTGLIVPEVNIRVAGVNLGE